MADAPGRGPAAAPGCRSRSSQLRQQLPKGVVCKAQSAHDVLEARLELTVNLDGEQRHLRLYFTEPDDEDRLLLSLSFRHKRGGKRGLEEQDDHIAEAQRRFESWAQTP
ncbi:hypothetical protein HMPREF1549_02079 [Actinomyces johnsonii F0510]|uniref:Uncharacterized protein n=1 Tax=Actinomyces johnsonii F0510 TaxID=1227262 RepID=U1Q6C0_9ACTO|nr:hypothetical protein HMPREF1549_02079 [Actinomyces johnsonii F0510]